MSTSNTWRSSRCSSARQRLPHQPLVLQCQWKGIRQRLRSLTPRDRSLLHHCSAGDWRGPIPGKATAGYYFTGDSRPESQWFRRQPRSRVCSISKLLRICAAMFANLITLLHDCLANWDSLIHRCSSLSSMGRILKCGKP